MTDPGQTSQANNSSNPDELASSVPVDPTLYSMARRHSFNQILHGLEDGQISQNPQAMRSEASAAAVLTNLQGYQHAPNYSQLVATALSSQAPNNAQSQAFRQLLSRTTGQTSHLQQFTPMEQLQQRMVGQQQPINTGHDGSSTQQTATLPNPYFQQMQGHLMYNPARVLVNPSQPGPDTPRSGQDGEKRQRRLEKNRLAAKECRRKRKEYLSGLELKVKHLSEENELLKAEIERLKRARKAEVLTAPQQMMAERFVTASRSQPTPPSQVSGQNQAHHHQHHHPPPPPPQQQQQPQASQHSPSVNKQQSEPNSTQAVSSASSQQDQSNQDLD